MTTFKKGDKFIPRKPKENNTDLAWLPEMDIYDGVILEVKQMTISGYLDPKGIVWSFHPNWCEKVEDNQSVEANEMVAENHIPEVRKMVESSEIPNNHERVTEVRKTITPEHLRISLALAGIYTDERCADLTLRVLEKVQELGVNFTINDACEIRGKWERDYQEISEK